VAKTKSVPPTPKRYTIGITIFVKTDGTLGFFENGLRQNVLFLYHMFKSSPNCERVYLLNHGDGDPTEFPEGIGLDKNDIVRTDKVIDQLDFAIMIGAAMDKESIAHLRRNGCGLVNYKGGNAAVISMEALIAKPPRSDAETYFDHDFYDAIWMTPQHMHTYRSWCETMYRCPVFEVPQVWSPILMELAAAPAKAEFGFRPPKGSWRIGIMDPNITVMKTSHLPMLVSEVAYRRKPEAIRAVYVTNGWPHRESSHFKSFFLSLSAAKAGIMTLEPRFVAWEFMANHCDAVVTHQWENGLNYLYYEVLFGGYPLVHNSKFIKDFGYYYEAFDADSGADALLRAMSEHSENLDAYRKNNQALIDRLDPAAAANIILHEDLLFSLQRRQTDGASPA
jgi:hypothetical protein